MPSVAHVERALDTFEARLAKELAWAGRGAGGLTPAQARATARREGMRLVTAMVLVDGRRSIGEPAWTGLDLSTSDDAERFLSQPSDVLDLLLATEGRYGAALTVYAKESRALLQTAAAIDGTNHELELSGLGLFEAMLADALARAPMDAPPIERPRPTTGLRDAMAEVDRRRTENPVTPALRTDTEKKADEREAEEAPQETVDQVLEELDRLVGLDDVKRIVHELVNVTRVEQMRADAGLPVPDRTHHLVFKGNPGTGKTTIARLLSRVFRALSIFERGHLVEVHRADLVAGYVGQTAPLTEAAVERALGGVLFIDEAYALVADGRDFGSEAITTLVKLMEDHREDFMVIAAGYPAEMQTFVAANPGLASRIRAEIVFPDYTPAELAAIFRIICETNGYVADVDDITLEAIFSMPDLDLANGNARHARRGFEEATVRQANRLVGSAPDRDALMTLTAADLGLPSPDRGGDDA
ncbi:MAG: AAA family ATPase [Actinomycetota bacterium]